MSSLEIMRTCLGSIPRMLCIASTSTQTPSQSSNNNDDSAPRLWNQLESEVKKLIDSDFVREEQHLNWVANIVLVPKKNGKTGFALTFKI